MSERSDSVLTAHDGKVLIVTLNRPKVRNAVNSATAHALAKAFQKFDKDDDLCVAVLTGAEGTFCAGADLHEVAEGRRTRIEKDGKGPMGPTWMQLSKPVSPLSRATPLPAGWSWRCGATCALPRMMRYLASTTAASAFP